MIRFATSENYLEKNASYSGVAGASAAAISWIENVLGIRVPINKGFRFALASGEVLCSLMNVIFPGSIKRINRCQNRASASDNLSLFLAACQTHCGIPKPRLFDISDFEDVLERGTESYSLVEKTEKNSERVAITIFWLAKFVDQDPRWTNFPKLDYEAFADLLPWRIIQATRQEPAEAEQWQLTKNSSRFPTTVAMGNNESTIVEDTLGASTDSPSQHGPIVEQQKNNNGIEEDNWQSNLDAWRERRRRISLQQATTLSSFEQLRQEEEKRKQETARDRLRQIILQHNTIYSSSVPCTSVTQPVTPSSPGLAILTGQAHGTVDHRDDTDCAPPPTPLWAFNGLDLGDSPTQKEKPVEASPVPRDPCVNGDSHLPPISAADHSKQQDVGKSFDHTDSDSETGISSSGGHGEIRLRLQSKPNSTEIRWGLTLKALGPSNTAPFVVEHVKIGSAADVCDLARGDVLLRVNDTDLRHSSASGSESITLSALEELLDRLSHNGHATSICVLKKRADCLDGEDSTGSTSAPAPPPASGYNEQNSDVDEQIVAETALTVNRNGTRAANSIHVVKPITHELSRTSTVDPNFNSKTPFKSSFPQSPMPGETGTTDLPNESVPEQAPLASPPRVEIPVRSSVSTRI